jgi:Protein phosphatase 2C
MQQYLFSTIGSFHTQHNEDAALLCEIAEDRILIAVMDGCSMGNDSFFASTLIAKLLRKIAKAEYYKTFITKKTETLEVVLHTILSDLFFALKTINNELDLAKDELLSTLILGIIDKSTQKAEIMAIGDGLISCNGVLTEYEQDNKPDYWGYHLNENFETWYAAQTQRLSLKNITDLSISTDGIFTFKAFDTRICPPITEDKIIDFLLNDKTDSSQTMLLKKMNFLEKEHGLKSSDDLSIIRLIF